MGHFSDNSFKPCCFILKIYEKDIPLGRVGKPEDVAYLAGFLADGGADYLSGRIQKTVNAGVLRQKGDNLFFYCIFVFDVHIEDLWVQK